MGQSISPKNPYNDPKGYQKGMGRILSELRKDQGMSQTDVGNKIDLSQRTMSDLEAGRNGALINYIRYADVVGIDFSVLVARARLWMEMNQLGE